MTPHIRTSGHLVEITDGRSPKQFVHFDAAMERFRSKGVSLSETLEAIRMDREVCLHGVSLNHDCGECREMGLPG